jgi:sterol desaturase/sphingolipid hydroxylase (fatty acid hydroxylase superfamily)
MDAWLNNTIRLAALLVVCAGLWSLEVLVPLFHYRPGRWRRIGPNLVLASLVVLANTAAASLMAWVSQLVIRNHVGLLSRAGSHPLLLALLGVAGFDSVTYVVHLLLHKIPWAWRVHRVHHSELEVDVTTAFRQHPLETLWRTLWQLVAMVVFGLPFWVVGLYLSLSSLNALFEHANLRIDQRLDAWLRLVIVTPSMHKIHHSRRVIETDSNYSNIFSIWDRLCGTYMTRGSNQGLRYGLEGCDGDDEQTLAGLLRMPLS